MGGVFFSLSENRFLGGCAAVWFTGWLRSHFNTVVNHRCVCVTPPRGQVTCISYHLINSYQCLGESWMGCYGLSALGVFVLLRVQWLNSATRGSGRPVWTWRHLASKMSLCCPEQGKEVFFFTDLEHH